MPRRSPGRARPFRSATQRSVSSVGVGRTGCCATYADRWSAAPLRALPPDEGTSVAPLDRSSVTTDPHPWAHEAVHLGRATRSWRVDLPGAIVPEADDLALADGPELVRLGREVAESWPTALGPPGQGRTLDLWTSLATVGAVDLTIARVIEPHLDALAILSQAGVSDSDRPGGLLGVYAAEGAGMRLTASSDGGRGWTLHGEKPWCSLAGEVDGFLVTAWVDDSRRGLFAVRRSAGVEIGPTAWKARGLAAVVSPTIRLHGVPALAVGDPQWYLERPGFAWGGMGVAAIWHGAAVGVARRLLASAGTRPPDQVALMHLGAVDAALHRSRAVLAGAADLIDGGAASGAAGARLVLQVRQVVRHSAEEVLERVAHALGPAPLTGDERHARRVADLQVYLRQEHAERDQAALGSAVLASDRPW